MGRQRVRVPDPGAWTEALTPRLRFVLGLPFCPGPAEEEKGEKATHGRSYPAWRLGGPTAPTLAGDGTVFFVQLLVCYPHAALRARAWM